MKLHKLIIRKILFKKIKLNDKSNFYLFRFISKKKLNKAEAKAKLLNKHLNFE